MSFAEKLLQYVRDNPGKTGTEIRGHFQSEATPFTVSSSLGRFQRMGLIENQGPKGTRWSRWYPIKFKQPKPEFLDLAREVLINLKNLSPSEREGWLALYLQNLGNPTDEPPSRKPLV